MDILSIAARSSYIMMGRNEPVAIESVKLVILATIAQITAVCRSLRDNSTAYACDHEQSRSDTDAYEPPPFYRSENRPCISCAWHVHAVAQ